LKWWWGALSDQLSGVISSVVDYVNVNPLLLLSYHWIAPLRVSCHAQLRYGVFETQARFIVLSV
jgi:hypothetical protein